MYVFIVPMAESVDALVSNTSGATQSRGRIYLILVRHSKRAPYTPKNTSMQRFDKVAFFAYLCENQF